MRTCVGCRQRRAQRELYRFVRTGDRSWRIEQPGGRRGPGRGAYLCGAACVGRAEKNKKYPGLASAAAEYGLEQG
ncbi:MAG: DUF448 domain-containing protein [Candidatus Eremiobacteraeota bacterium]|nr:DUF448 domain-containing protein [Candidatus Eremiobacteraeota bacterium]